jgi:hypothetical protein
MQIRPVARKDNLVIETLPDEIIVYDQTRNAAHCLNNSVNWIWERCDGSGTIEDIASEFERSCGLGDAHALVLSAVKQLAAANLVTGVPRDESARIEKMTRRAAVALGASVAPIVTSIIVPTPAAAQSRLGPENTKVKPKPKPKPKSK